MKLESKGVTNVVYGDVEQRKFGLAIGGRVFDILSNKLYADKILAPIRELICNALDSQIEAGNSDKKFIVHLPNKFEPYFSVRDFGTGLSHQEILDIYTVYGLTTKDTTNKAIGCLGLGSKSPFAYTDMFEVYSYKDGTLNVYQCAREEDAPTVTKFSTSKTDEPNGLEVRFAVKNYDYYDFSSRLGRMFFLQNYMDVRGDAVDFPEIPKLVYGHVYEILDQTTSNLPGQINVEMGGVVYRVEEIDRSNIVSCFSSKLSYGKRVIIHADIGAVDITVSREQVELTDKSRAFIDKALKEYMDNVVEQVIKEVKKEPDILRKLLRYRELKAKIGAFGYVRPLENRYNRFLRFVRDMISIATIIPNKRGVDKRVIIGLLNDPEILTNDILSGDWPIFVDCVGKQVTPPELRVFCNKFDCDVHCVKDEFTLKQLERFKIPVHKLEEYAEYKPARPKRTYSRKRDASSDTEGKHLIVSGLSSKAFNLDMAFIKEAYEKGRTIWWCEKGHENDYEPAQSSCFINSLAIRGLPTWIRWPCITSISCYMRTGEMYMVTVSGDAALKRVKNDPQFRSIEAEFDALVKDKATSRKLALDVVEDAIKSSVRGYEEFGKTSLGPILYAHLKNSFTDNFGVTCLPYVKKILLGKSEETESVKAIEGDKATAKEIRRAVLRRMLTDSATHVGSEYKRHMQRYIREKLPLLDSYVTQRCHVIPVWSLYPKEVQEDLMEYVNKVVRRIKKERSVVAENVENTNN